MSLRQNVSAFLLLISCARSAAVAVATVDASELTALLVDEHLQRGQPLFVRASSPCCSQEAELSNQLLTKHRRKLMNTGPSGTVIGSMFAGPNTTASPKQKIGSFSRSMRRCSCFELWTCDCTEPEYMFDEVTEVLTPPEIQRYKSTTRLGMGPDGSGVGIHSGAGALVRPLTGGAVSVILWPTGTSQPLDTRPVAVIISQLRKQAPVDALLLSVKPGEILLVPEGWGVGWGVEGADSVLLVHQMSENQQTGSLGKLLQTAQAEATGDASVMDSFTPEAKLGKLAAALSARISEAQQVQDELSDDQPNPAAGLRPILAQAYCTMANIITAKAKKENGAFRQASLNRAAKLVLSAEELEPASGRIVGEVADVFFEVYQLAGNISQVSAMSALEQAVSSYRKAISLSSSQDGSLHQNLGAALLSLAMEKEEISKAHEAIHHLSRLMQAERTWPPISSPVMIAEQLMQMAFENKAPSFTKLLHSTAKSFVTRAIELQPQEAQAHILQARMHMHAGEFSNAKQCAETALELDKQATESWLTLAELHGRLGERPQAAAVLKDAARYIKGDKVIDHMLSEYADYS